jgi:hypothetical protein
MEDFSAFAPGERKLLVSIVDGEHFFDIVDEHTVYEVLYDRRALSRSLLRRGAHRIDLVLNRALTGKGSPRTPVPVPRIRYVALEQVDDSVHPRGER